MEAVNYPLPDLPTQQELLCALIREELRSHQFFNGLRELGLDDVYHQTDLSTLILTIVRLNPHIDAIQ